MSTQNPYSSPQIGAQALTSSGQLASLGDRFLGALIDGLIMLPVVAVLSVLMGIVLRMVFGENSVIASLLSNVMGIGLGLGAYLAINGRLLATRGQTVGKMVMKTQIVADDGSPVSFETILLKRLLPVWIVGAIPCVGLIFNLADALLIFRENRKCLHDDIAGTKVIKLAA